MRAALKPTCFCDYKSSASLRREPALPATRPCPQPTAALSPNETKQELDISIRRSHQPEASSLGHLRMRRRGIVPR